MKYSLNIICMVMFLFLISSIKSFADVYPVTNFNHIESLCVELWLDLDQAYTNQMLQKKIVENSDYLIDQFLLLQKCLEKIAQDPEESSVFLLEDLEYLAAIIKTLEQKYNQLCMQLPHQDDMKQNIVSLIEQSKQCITKLFSCNKEVML